MRFRVAEISERLRHSFDFNSAGDPARQIDLALGNRGERGGELSGVVTQRELNVEFAPDAKHRVDVIGLHAHADHENSRVPRGDAHCFVDHARHTNGFEDHERSDAIDLAPRIDRSCLAGIDHNIRAEAFGERASTR